MIVKCQEIKDDKLCNCIMKPKETIQGFEKVFVYVCPVCKKTRHIKQSEMNKFTDIKGIWC